MKNILGMWLVLTLVIPSHSKEFWRNFNEQGATIEIRKHDLLVPKENLMTCEHMKMRFEKIHFWLKEAGELIYSQIKLKNELYSFDFLEYYYEKIDISRYDEWSRPVAKVSGKIRSNWDLEVSNGIASIVSGKFEITRGAFEHIPIFMEIDSGNVQIEVDLTLADICLNQKINLVFMKSCKEIPQQPLSNQDLSNLNTDYDWDQCEIYEIYTLNLKPISKILGDRNLRLGRSR